MIGQPAGWTRHATGNRIVLVPPEGITRGGIRYDERVAPLRNASAILEDQLTRETAFRVERAGPWERLVTVEGEHAATITIDGLVDGVSAQRSLGIVFLDDAYALIAGYCLHVEDFSRFSSSVRALTLGDCHFLGVRRRWFEYMAPTGWQARRRSFMAEWFPPDYPNDRAMIVVWPALPKRVISAEAFVAQFAATSTLPSSIETASNYQLSAHLLMIDGELRTRLVVLEDDRYIYPLRLDAASREHDLRFETCIASIRPIPAPAREISPALAFAWVD